MTRYHMLAADELDAIASGEPDATVTQTLLSAQYSKRVVMMQAILAVAADRSPAAYARLEEAYGLLAAAQQADPAAVQAILTHPSAGIWAARCLNDLQSPPADLVPRATGPGLLAAFSPAAAIRAGHAFTIEVPVRDRAVFLPTLGLVTFGPESTVAADFPVFATVRHDGQRVTIAAGRSVVTLPPDPARDGPGWQGVRRLRACHDGASITVELDDLDPDRGTHDVPLAGRLDDGAVAAWQAVLDGAWATLTRHHPRRAIALAAGLRCIVPLEPAGKIGQSVTDAAGFGGIVLSPPRDPLSFADTLIHEFHHSVLAAVAGLAPLHSAGPDAVHYSPWRNDPRPVEGLLQGAYAYLGVAGYWETQRRVVTGRERALAEYEFARWRHQILLAARVLRESGTLTQTGATVVRGVAATAEHWRDLPVAEEPRVLAERAITDHWVRWCLLNRRPAEVSIDAIARAWQDGLRCPVRMGDVPVTVQPRQRLLGLGERSRLFHLRLADPGSFRALCADPGSLATAGAGTSAADLAYAADDFERAAEGYRAAIRQRPDDIESWAGMLLANAELPGRSALRAVAPEIVRCVYLTALRSAGTDPDLDKLQEWLGDVA